MKLIMEYEENNWKVTRTMELDNDEKLAARVLNSVKKYQADKRKAEKNDGGDIPSPSGFACHLPQGGGKDGGTAAPANSLTGGKDGGTAAAMEPGPQEPEEASPLSQPSAASSPVGGALGGEMTSAAGPSVGGASERYQGMLICECGSCHKTRAFTTKYPLAHYKCSECGESTDLTDMADAELTCLSCGKVWHYKTNVLEASVEAACPRCGKLLTGWWDKKKKVYTND